MQRLPDKNSAMKLPSLLLLFFAFILPAAADDRHLFILSGQSNMQGLKPESAFLPELKKLLPDADIVHVKFAQGGQPIRKWVKNWDEIAAKHGLKGFEDPGNFYDKILSLAKAEIEKGKPETITFLWMQGEKDAKTNVADAYEESFKTLIANLRKDLDAPEMHFVVGRLSDHKPASGQWEEVRKILVKVAEEDPHGAWVDTDDTNDKVKQGKAHDDLHYTKEGYDLFGRRLARQAVRMIEGEKPDPKGRPE